VIEPCPFGEIDRERAVAAEPQLGLVGQARIWLAEEVPREWIDQRSKISLRAGVGRPILAGHTQYLSGPTLSPNSAGSFRLRSSVIGGSAF